MINKYYIAGKKRAQEKDYAGAIPHYSKAIEFEPNNADIYSDRGVAYFHTMNLDKSISDMNQAVYLEPKNSYRYSSRAYIKGAKKDFEGAIKDYEKAVELDPEDSIAYNNLGLILEQAGYQKQAERNFKQADELSETNPIANLPTVKANNELNKLPSEKPVNGIVKPKKTLTILEIIASIFTKKDTFNEFLKYIKNGFRLN